MKKDIKYMGAAEVGGDKQNQITKTTVWAPLGYNWVWVNSSWRLTRD